jgi:hypothetical protein
MDMRPLAGRLGAPLAVLAGAVLAALSATTSVTTEARRDAARISIVREPPTVVPNLGRIEVDFQVMTGATFPHWPYDPKPPAGIPPAEGINASAEFIDPQGRHYRQPAFQYQRFEDAVQLGRDWHYPTSEMVWKVRFSPNQEGGWKYRLAVEDRRGAEETEWRTFTVQPSSSHGFVRVSRADSRYFEFEDGTLFTGLGFEVPEHLDAPVTRGTPMYRELAGYGVNFARLWISSLYGSAWVPYIGGKNRYAGYLPVAGLMPFIDETTGTTTLTMRMAYRPGDQGWFDPCRLEGWNFPEAVKPQRRYRVSATYWGRRLQGPRIPRFPGYGFVMKLGGAFEACQEPGTSRVVTSYGRNTSGWAEIAGDWNSGGRYFLPKLHLALENVSDGGVFVRSVSVREYRPDGSLGPEILSRPSMEYHHYVSQSRAHALDRIVELAERAGVYLKLVVMEKDDEIYQNLTDEGTFITDRPNPEGVYGLGRGMNRTRWLQQAWWRYLQARWGYSPAIHSWELVNEGNPTSRRHYELADEFGKFMHYGVFGEQPRAGFDHPNDHLVTTSFWTSFPVKAFWANPQYAHVDYADIHAYVSTSFAPRTEKDAMQWDAAYYHIWHSQAAAAARLGKPVVRGEAGLDSPDRPDDRALGIVRDRGGVWLHNFLWAGLDAGGLYEIYWWQSHIVGRQFDHRSEYRRVGRFLATLDLNKGGYADWAGTASTPALRVVGQKNPKSGRMHLWIQNTSHTWKAVADGLSIAPASGAVRVPGFEPRRDYDVDWWDTWHDDEPRRERLSSDAAGVLTLPVDGLVTDVAVTTRPAVPAAEQ